MESSNAHIPKETEENINKREIKPIIRDEPHVETVMEGIYRLKSKS